MPIRKEEIQNDQFYHVYNRGLGEIFRGNKDCRKFMVKAKRYARTFNVRIFSYALMENHFHFLLKQDKENGIADLMKRLQQSHALYFNIKYYRKGQFFESRFKTKAVTTEEYFIEIRRYIANNPLEKILQVSTRENSLINSSIVESGTHYPLYLDPELTI